MLEDQAVKIGVTKKLHATRWLLRAAVFALSYPMFLILSMQMGDPLGPKDEYGPMAMLYLLLAGAAVVLTVICLICFVASLVAGLFNKKNTP